MSKKPPRKPLPKLPYKIKTHANVFIPLSDGTKLAARLWLPVGTEKKPVPALLEYLPYRKGDLTAARDQAMHGHLAAHGYACLRVDLRGTGDSHGLLADEYLKLEQDDALEVLAWARAQTWCDGNLGMFGLSWGGFNALQVAARQPLGLKAIISACASDDRYEDDVHYKGGALLGDNQSWAAAMWANMSLPPDPKVVGKNWKKMWLHRLKHQPFLAVPWLQHPHLNEYWKQGSVAENYGQITAATLLVGGFMDAYVNAIPRLMQSLRSPRKAIIGPWAHEWPHLAAGGQAIEFLPEMLRWFDYHLKAKDTGVMQEPDYRVFLLKPLKPGAADVSGWWIGLSDWGPTVAQMQELRLGETGLTQSRSTEKALSFTSPLTTGFDGGKFMASDIAVDWPGDQARDDSASLTFDSPPVGRETEILGRPVVELSFSVNKPVAQVVVRLNDVWPTGEVSRISYQVLNLTQRMSRGQPTPLTPNKRQATSIKLNEIAYALPAGHRLRISISTSGFPLVWPAPEQVALTVYTDASYLQLPVRKAGLGARPANFTALALPPHKGAALKRVMSVVPKSGETILEATSVLGAQSGPRTGVSFGQDMQRVYSIKPDEPLSAKIETRAEMRLKRGALQIRTLGTSKLTSTKSHWIVEAKLEAFEGKKRVFAKTVSEKIPRKLV